MSCAPAFDYVARVAQCRKSGPTARVTTSRGRAAGSVEVISGISEDPAGPVDWWLNQSPAVHGRALRDSRWREIGVGYAEGGEYGHYWTVLVGCPALCSTARPTSSRSSAATRRRPRSRAVSATRCGCTPTIRRLSGWPAP